MGTKYHVYKHSKSGEEVVRTLSYSLPRELDSHVDLVAPTTYFGNLRTMKSTSSLKPKTSAKSATFTSPESPLFCNAAVTPKCLQSMYKTIDYIPKSKKNKLGVAGYLDQFANYADLQVGQLISLLFAHMNLFLPRRFLRISALMQLVLASALSAFMAEETTRVIQASRPTWIFNIPPAFLSQPPMFTTGKEIHHLGDDSIINQHLQSTGGSPKFIPDSVTPTNTNEPYLDFLEFIFDSKDIPQVLTTSYGDDEQTVCLVSPDQEAQL